MASPAGSRRSGGSKWPLFALLWFALLCESAPPTRGDDISRLALAPNQGGRSSSLAAPKRNGFACLMKLAAGGGGAARARLGEPTLKQPTVSGPTICSAPRANRTRHPESRPAIPKQFWLENLFVRVLAPPRETVGPIASIGRGDKAKGRRRLADHQTRSRLRSKSSISLFASSLFARPGEPTPKDTSSKRHRHRLRPSGRASESEFEL